jgi:hypothetical protein
MRVVVESFLFRKGDVMKGRIVTFRILIILQIFLMSVLTASIACAEAWLTNTVTVRNDTPLRITVTANCVQYPIFGWGGETSKFINNITKSIQENDSAPFKCASGGIKIGIEDVSVTSVDDRSCSIKTPFNEDKTWYVKIMFPSRFKLSCTENP